jgi:hypothetical protein
MVSPAVKVHECSWASAMPEALVVSVLTVAVQLASIAKSAAGEKKAIELL